MATVQSKIPVTPDIIRSAIISGTHDGLNQNEIAVKFGHKKNWITYWLKRLGLNWKEMVADQIRKNNQNKVQNTKIKTKIQKNTKKKKKTRPTSKPTQNKSLDQTSDPDDPDPDDDDQSQDQKNSSNIPEQFRGMIDLAVYADDKGIKASTSDIIRYYEKTKQLEDEQKDFEDDIGFLGQVEGLVRNLDELKIIIDIKDLENE